MDTNAPKDAEVQTDWSCKLGQRKETEQRRGDLRGRGGWWMKYQMEICEGFQRKLGTKTTKSLVEVFKENMVFLFFEGGGQAQTEEVRGSIPVTEAWC